jgi:hypothetical protein
MPSAASPALRRDTRREPAPAEPRRTVPPPSVPAAAPTGPLPHRLGSYALARDVIQPVFAWTDKPRDAPSVDEKLSEVRTRSGTLKVGFLDGVRELVEKRGAYTRVKRSVVADAFDELVDDTKITYLKRSSFFESLVQAIVAKIGAPKAEDYPERDEAKPSTRTHSNPKVAVTPSRRLGRKIIDLDDDAWAALRKGTSEEKPTLKRRLSISEGVIHAPVFSRGGEGTSKLVTIDDNATYSIGAYKVGEDVHLLSGTLSGDTDADWTQLEGHAKKRARYTPPKTEESKKSKEVGEGSEDEEREEKHAPIGTLHAEEGQLELFERQITLDAHGVGEALRRADPVVVILHISKSPCSDNCQRYISRLLTKYPSLEIQMHLEIPYLANDPTEMEREGIALGQLIRTFSGRLAYRVVSVHEPVDAESPAYKHWGGVAELIYLNLVHEGASSKNTQLAQKRREKWSLLQKLEVNPLPPEGDVAHLRG